MTKARRPRVSVGDILEALGYAILIPLARWPLFFIACVIGMVLDLAGYYIYGSPILSLPLGLWIVIGPWVFVSRIRKILAAKTKAYVEAERQAGKARDTAAAVRFACTKAAGEFEELPNDLARVRQQLDEARTDYQDQLYSQFWQSIERARTALDDYRKRLEQITECYWLYTRYDAEYHELQETEPLPHFPVRAVHVESVTVARSAPQELEALIHRAAKNHACAQQFEQTHLSSEVADLDGLTSAVEQMEPSLKAAIRQLTAAVADLAPLDLPSHGDLIGPPSASGAPPADQQDRDLRRRVEEAISRLSEFG